MTSDIIEKVRKFLDDCRPFTPAELLPVIISLTEKEFADFKGAVEDTAEPSAALSDLMREAETADRAEALRQQILCEIDTGADYLVARKAVAELSGKPVMALTFEEHIEVIRALLKAAQPANKGAPPMDGTTFYAVGSYKIPMRYKLYKPSSNEFKRGIKGRWQQMNDFGGWENTDFEPGAWVKNND